MLNQQMASGENANWTSPSASPSPPPPPPLPPQAAASRWSRASQASAESNCPYCRGRYGSIQSRTTSLNSYSAYCKERASSMSRPSEDDSSYPTALCERDLHSLQRSVPALKRRNVDAVAAAIRQHYYPEGGWGWIVCGAAFLAHLLTSGLQLSFGLLYLYTLQYLSSKGADKEHYVMATAWLGVLCLCVSLSTSPIVVAVCRRKSTRLIAVLGGLLMALACLFTSFAVQFHQMVLSYGLMLGIASGLVKETSALMLGHYFKKRREFVEMVAQAGTGVGVALFSVLYKEAVGKLGWRLGLQAVTGLLSLAFFLGIVYRSAAIYHPQRRAILHLRNHWKKVKDKRPQIKLRKSPLLDFGPLRSFRIKILLVSSATAAFGIYTPIFYLAYQGYREGLEDSALVLLQTFLGFASALGCVSFGLVIVRPSMQCLISRQYLCQAAMAGIGVSLLALSAVQGYHGYVLFVWLYGICLGGFTYSLKMFTLEHVRARHFTKAWSFVQGAESIPVLLGVPITGYINQTHPKAGYYFSFASTVLGAVIMFLVGSHRKDRPPSAVSSASECVCPVRTPSFTHTYNPELYHCPIYRQPSVQYKHDFSGYDDPSNSLGRKPQHRCSYRIHREHTSQYLPKSLSYAANMEYSGLPGINCIAQDAEFVKYNYAPHRKQHLRPSKSVPEGLARWDWPSYQRPVRNIQVIEQITTSV